MKVSLRQLRAFLAVARLGSFTRAAALLHLTQPALTVQIRQLEQALGVRLLDRTTRSAEPTRVGEELAYALRPLIADLDSVLAGVRDLAARRRGLVHLAALPSVASTLVPAAVARLQARNPGIRVRMREAVTGPVGEMVRTGAVDLGIGGAVGEDPELEAEHLFDDPLMAVLPAGHALARSRRLSLEALAGVPLLLPEPDSVLRRLLDHGFAEAGLQVAPAQEAVNTGTLVGMVRAGLGVAVLPSTAVELQVASDLVARPIGSPPLARPIALVRLARRTLSPAAEAFVAAFRECLPLRTSTLGDRGGLQATPKSRQQRRARSLEG
jgi:DNA-binding transcriptional LysR family regulator